MKTPTLTAALAAIALTGAAQAATPAPARTTPAVAHPAPAAKPSMFSRLAGMVKPAATPAAAHPATRTAARGNGRMVRAKLANGQTVTYNCSLPGNATKQACK
jgi:hypothetical protein